jgi:hypothetical protein
VLTDGLHFVWLDNTEAAFTERLLDNVLKAGVDGGDSIRKLRLAEERGKELLAPCVN